MKKSKLKHDKIMTLTGYYFPNSRFSKMLYSTITLIYADQNVLRF
jgi:hypothetical protein